MKYSPLRAELYIQVNYSLCITKMFIALNVGARM